MTEYTYMAIPHDGYIIFRSDIELNPKDLCTHLNALEQRVETAETIIERRDAKIKRQAEWITRLETSRASLREALASQEKECQQ